MSEFLSRLLGRRRPAPTPEPELPAKSYREHVEEEVKGLRERAEFFAGTHVGAMFHDVATTTQAELDELTHQERAA